MAELAVAGASEQLAIDISEFLRSVAERNNLGWADERAVKCKHSKMLQHSLYFKVANVTILTSRVGKRKAQDNSLGNLPVKPL